MKKLMLLATVAAFVSFTSCKKEAEKVADGTEEVLNDTGEVLTDAGEAVGDAANEAGAAISDLAKNASEATQNAWEEAKAAVTDAPNLTDADLQKWVNDLHGQAVKAKAASIGGSPEDLTAATNEIATLAAALPAHSAKADYAKAEAYFNEIKAELEQL